MATTRSPLYTDIMCCLSRLSSLLSDFCCARRRKQTAATQHDSNTRMRRTKTHHGNPSLPLPPATMALTCVGETVGPNDGGGDGAAVGNNVGADDVMSNENVPTLVLVSPPAELVVCTVTTALLPPMSAGNRAVVRSVPVEVSMRTSWAQSLCATLSAAYIVTVSSPYIVHKRLSMPSCASSTLCGATLSHCYTQHASVHICCL